MSKNLLAETLEKELETEMLWSPWNSQIVCISGGWGWAPTFLALLQPLTSCSWASAISVARKSIRKAITWKFCLLQPFLGFPILMGYLFMNNLVSSRRCKLMKLQLMALSIEWWLKTGFLCNTFEITL